MKIFWDTNVLVDLLLVRRPFYESASTLLSLAEENNWDVIVSSLSIMNAYYICCERAKMSREMWEHKIIGFSSLASICCLDSDIILNSCSTGWGDFEDCVQHNCAILNQCEYIITRNTKDFRLSSIPVMEPDDFIIHYQ